MRIVLDTNILQEDFLLRGTRFDMLLDYVQRTASSVALPAVVLDELAANYSRKLRERVSSLVRAADQLNGLLATPQPVPSVPNTEAETSALRSHVLRRLSITERQLLPLKPEHLDDVVDRAIRRCVPCHGSGEEMRDALIWLTVRDLALSTKDKIVFISRNTSQFSADKSTLHPALGEEARALGADVEYYASIEEFIKQHATPIAFITKEWLEAQISGDTVFDSVRRDIERMAERRVERLYGYDEEPTGDVEVSGGWLELDEFFVYQMKDASIRIESTWVGNAELTFEVMIMEEESGWEYEFDAWNQSYEPRWGRHRRRRRRTRTREMDIAASVELVVENRQVVDWSASISSW